MALETLNPTAHVSPDPGLSVDAMTSHTNTGCSGGVVGVGGDPDPSYKATTIPNSTKTGITAKDLKFSWNISLFSGTTGTVSTTIDYSINGGAGWINATSVTNASQTSSASISLGTGQDLSLVQVRAICAGGGPTTGTERQMSLSLSNIRVEVTYLAAITGASGGMM